MTRSADSKTARWMEAAKHELMGRAKVIVEQCQPSNGGDAKHIAQSCEALVKDVLNLLETRQRDAWGLSEEERVEAFRSGESAYWRRQWVDAFGKLNWLKTWLKHVQCPDAEWRRILGRELDLLTSSSPITVGLRSDKDGDGAQE